MYQSAETKMHVTKGIPYVPAELQSLLTEDELCLSFHNYMLECNQNVSKSVWHLIALVSCILLAISDWLTSLFTAEG